MTTATSAAAAPAAAAPARDLQEIRTAALLDIEQGMRHGLGVQALEDVPAEQLKLREGGGTFMGLDGPYVWSTPSEVAVRELQGDTTYLQLSAPKARAAVLEMRAADPHAAHARDLEYALRVANGWLSSYENASRRLEDPTHPGYVGNQRPTDPGALYEPYSSHGEAVEGRDRYSALLARWITGIQAMRQRGPHLPEQGCLF